MIKSKHEGRTKTTDCAQYFPILMARVSYVSKWFIKCHSKRRQYTADRCRFHGIGSHGKIPIQREPSTLNAGIYLSTTFPYNNFNIFFSDLCKPGYYCLNGNTDLSLPCRYGTYQPFDGQTSSSSCIQCPNPAVLNAEPLTSCLTGQWW